MKNFQIVLNIEKVLFLNWNIMIYNIMNELY